MTKIHMYLAVSIILTMLPTLVTASPLPSLTRDNVAKRNKKDPNVVRYLVQYGHLDNKLDARNVTLFQKLKQQPNMAETSDVFLSTDEISNGIKSFQNSFGSEVSGDLNEETIKVIDDSQRCGISDINRSPTNPFQLSIHRRSRRYTIKHKTKSGGYKVFKWSKTSIIWDIETYYKGTSLSHKQQNELFDKAFKFWEYASPLRFVRKTTEAWADIDIEFIAGSHGDGSPFDGVGGKVAHAFLPGTSKSGDIHFDAAETWTPQHLLDVAIHEIGHSIGLGHSSVYGSIMYPTYTGMSGITTLPQDDRDGLSKLYGPCETKIDAVIDLPQQDVYFIRKDLVWKYDSTSERVYSGYPKKVNDEFPTASGPKIPPDLDGATRFIHPFYPKRSGTQFFIFAKGDTLYIYDEDKKKISVEPISKYWLQYKSGPAVPNDVDAIVSDTDFDAETLVFKGDQVWEIDNRHQYKSVKPGYPKKISALQQFAQLPKDVDDGYYDEFFSIYYFFKGTRYWMIPHTGYWGYRIVPGGFIHQKWKGICSAKY